LRVCVDVGTAKSTSPSPCNVHDHDHDHVNDHVNDHDKDHDKDHVKDRGGALPQPPLPPANDLRS
jgi:hypothetical protein